MRFRILAHCLFFCGIAASFAQDANAFCNPLLTYRRIVGDTASDKNCTDNTIQDAIDNATCPNTTIFITSEHKYLGIHLLIEGKTLSLVGTDSPTCSIGVGNQRPEDTPLTPLITLSGQGHSGDSVISIQDNSNVTLQYLTITGGASDKDQFGGGIYYSGQGSLTLNTTDVTQNFAGYGGGINIEGSGSGATLTLDRVQIAFNTAQYNGGGIRAEGATHIYMLDASSSISFNQTIGPDAQDSDGGHGGGIVIFGPAIADIASPAALLSNSGQFGGGIAVLATSSGDAVARLFGVNGLPVGLSSNTGSNLGGAVFLHSTSDNTARFCALDFRIDSNAAPQGAAIYEDSDHAPTIVYLNNATDTAFCEDDVSPSIESLGAVPCSASQTCNEISDNAAVDSQDQPSGGPIIYLGDEGNYELNRFAMRGNQGGQLMTVIGDETDDLISNCLLADNHTQHELVHEEGSGIPISNCTFANNTIDDGYVFFAKAGFRLSDSIVYEPGVSTIDYLDDGCGGCFSASNVISTETATFPPGSANIVQINDPLFVDAANANPDNRDYHLVAYIQDGKVTASPAIDFAPPISGDDRDLDNNPHDQDVPGVGSQLLDRDLGAYEAQPITDRVFGDAFGDRLSLLK